MNKLLKDLKKHKDNPQNPLMNPLTLLDTVKSLIREGRDDIAMTLVEKLNLTFYGGELLYTAVLCQNTEFIDALIKKGISLNNVPNKITPHKGEEAAADNYRETPFIVLSAKIGSIKMVQFMLRCGRNLNEVGFIGFSSRKRNSLVGNLICSAVYNGHLKLVDWFIQNDRNLNLEHQVQEKPRIAKGLLVKEFHKFTALMLAVAIGNLEIVKKLIESGNAKVNVHDSNKNSLLHIAVKYNAQNIVKYFLENPRDIKIFDRNHKGETALSIAHSLNNKELITLLSTKEDSSLSITEKLLQELQENQVKEENKRKKKREKKKRLKNRKNAGENQEEEEKDQEIAEEIVDSEEEKEEPSPLPQRETKKSDSPPISVPSSGPGFKILSTSKDPPKPIKISNKNISSTEESTQKDDQISHKLPQNPLLPKSQNELQTEKKSSKSNSPPTQSKSIPNLNLNKNQKTEEITKLATETPFSHNPNTTTQAHTTKSYQEYGKQEARVVMHSKYEAQHSSYHDSKNKEFYREKQGFTPGSSSYRAHEDNQYNAYTQYSARQQPLYTPKTTYVKKQDPHLKYKKKAPYQTTTHQTNNAQNINKPIHPAPNTRDPETQLKPTQDAGEVEGKIGAKQAQPQGVENKNSQHSSEQISSSISPSLSQSASISHSHSASQSESASPSYSSNSQKEKQTYQNTHKTENQKIEELFDPAQNQVRSIQELMKSDGPRLQINVGNTQNKDQQNTQPELQLSHSSQNDDQLSESSSDENEKQLHYKLGQKELEIMKLKKLVDELQGTISGLEKRNKYLEDNFDANKVCSLEHTIEMMTEELNGIKYDKETQMQEITEEMKEHHDISEKLGSEVNQLERKLEKEVEKRKDAEDKVFDIVFENQQNKNPRLEEYMYNISSNIQTSDNSNAFYNKVKHINKDIQELLHLANTEIRNKNTIINLYKNQNAKLKPADIETMDNTQRHNLHHLYTQNLKTIQKYLK